MLSVNCFFCGHAIPPSIAGNSCPNCGAPVTQQTDTPAGAKATQVLFPLLWSPDSAPLVSNQLSNSSHTAGLLGRDAAAHAFSNTTFSNARTEPFPSVEKAMPVDESHPAVLEGVVDTPPTKNTVDVPLEWWSQGMLRLFFPPVFTMLSRYLLVAGPQQIGEPTPQPKPTMTVYTVRVRRDDHTLGEARLEGDLIEGEPSLGDHLLLRGHFRGNTLIVDEGYNQSFHPPMRIKIRPPLPQQRARVAVITLLALLIVTSGLFLSFLPLFAHHAHLLQQNLWHFYLGVGIAFGVLAFLLYSISGALIRILMALFVLIAGLAVYLSLGGAGLPPLPLHL